MSTVAWGLVIASGAGLSAAALLAIIRIVRGPTILDRMIASDMLLTTLMLALGVDMVVRGHTDSIAIMTAIAATATFATITVARYVRRRTAMTRPVTAPLSALGSAAFGSRSSGVPGAAPGVSAEHIEPVESRPHDPDDAGAAGEASENEGE